MPSKEDLMKAREIDNKGLVKGVRYSNTHSSDLRYQGEAQGGRKGHTIKRGR